LHLSTLKEVAAHLDLSGERVRQLVNRGVIPAPAGKAQYDIEASRVAYIRYLRGVAGGQVSAEPSELDAAHERARKDKAQADKTELEVARLKRQVVQWASVEKAWGGMLSRIRAKLLTLPSKIAPLVQASDGEYQSIVEITRRAVSDAMRELSDDPGEELAEAPEVQPLAESTAGTDGERVGGRASKAKP
jgi:phage terminase Nu1 subunit (DNA packaging protein)